MKEWKLFEGGGCPNCGNDLEVYSSLPASKDDEFGIMVHDDDPVRCVECKFRSAISADEGRAYVQDGNIDELEDAE